jgi:hypothetical protein
VRAAVQHVVPDDIREHELSAKCWCRPAVKEWNVTHWSRDGRAWDAPRAIRCVYVDGGPAALNASDLRRVMAEVHAGFREDLDAVMRAASRV